MLRVSMPMKLECDVRLPLAAMEHLFIQAVLH